MTVLRAPFVYYGGKAPIAAQVWEFLGDVPNFVEPFFGSGAVLLNRPTTPKLETVNDADGLLCNAWRALQANPAAVAQYADWPVNECDLHARHAWLVGQKDSLQARLEGDPYWYDAQAAGWWLWGMCVWIGGEFCSGKGPWQVVDGQLVHLGNNGRGIHRQRVHLGNNGRGIHRQRVHLGNNGQGIHRRLVHLGNNGQGVHRRRVHLGGGGGGVDPIAASARVDALAAWFTALATRLRSVRVCCGDWTRVMGPSVTVTHGLTGIFLDPPYSADRESRIYRQDSLTVAKEVQAWCLEHGSNPLLRLVLCGYGDEHDVLLAHGWRKWTWKANGGYGNSGSGRGRANASLEAVWCSPHCVQTRQLALFASDD